MPARNTETRWGWVAQLLHWATATLILLQLGLAAYILTVDDLVRRYEAGQMHKSWGAVILCVGLVRLLWRASSRITPQMPPAMPAWEVRAAWTSHFALYALIVALPLSGWIYASAAPLQTLLGIENRVFGTVVQPDPWPEGDQRIADIAWLLHRSFAVALVGLVIVHVGAALKHHFVYRDGVLRRMLP